MAATDDASWAITPELRAPYTSGSACASDHWEIEMRPVANMATRYRRWYSRVAIQVRRSEIARGAATRRARKGGGK